MVLRGRKMKFERFRVYCVLMKVCLSLPQHKRLQYRKIRYRKRELHAFKCHGKLISQPLARNLYDVGALTGKKMNRKKTWYRTFPSFTIALFDFVSDYFSWERECIWFRGKTIVIINMIFLCPCFVALICLTDFLKRKNISAYYEAFYGLLITKPVLRKWISAKESWMSDFNK